MKIKIKAAVTKLDWEGLDCGLDDKPEDYYPTGFNVEITLHEPQFDAFAGLKLLVELSGDPGINETPALSARWEGSLTEAYDKFEQGIDDDYRSLPDRDYVNLAKLTFDLAPHALQFYENIVDSVQGSWGDVATFKQAVEGYNYSDGLKIEPVTYEKEIEIELEGPPYRY